jgi:chromosome partitioning protein
MLLAVVQQKGGVGKSTTAVAVAAELQARGHSVLLVDADPQGSARTWAAVAAEQGHPTPTTVAMDATLAQPGQLPKLAPSFAHTVLDVPPRSGAVQRAALMVADVALLPCGAGALDAWALTETVELVREAQAVRPELVAAVLLTRVQSGTALGRGARAVLSEAGLPVLHTELGLRVAFVEALAAGLGVGAYAPGSPAALEVAALVAELLALDAGRKGARRRGR